MRMIGNFQISKIKTNLKTFRELTRTRGRHRTRNTIDNKKPSDRITHARTMKISRSE